MNQNPKTTEEDQTIHLTCGACTHRAPKEVWKSLDPRKATIDLKVCPRCGTIRIPTQTPFDREYDTYYTKRPQ